MIVEEFNIQTTTGWPAKCKNRNNIQQFKSMFLVSPEFSFGNIDDFTNENIWIQAIKDGYIIPVLNIKNVIDNYEETLYNTGEDDTAIFIKNGKYIFKLQYFVSFYFHKNLRTLSQQDFDVIFVDRNNQVLAYSPDEIEIKGFEINLINIEDQVIGDTKLSYTPVYVELKDSRQYNDYGIVEKMDFNINNLNLIFVDITDISGTIDELYFKVTDKVYRFEIEGLTEFQITDITNGILTYTTLKDNGDGNYYITGLSDDLTAGTIAIDEDNYYGSAAYAISSILGEIYDITATTSQISFKFRNASTLTAITGLTISDIILTDNINGTIIAIITEVSAGSYTLTLPDKSFWSGTIAIDNGSYADSESYQTLRNVNIINVNVTSSTQIEFSVTDVLEIIAVTNLLQSEISFIDDTNGALTINTFNNLGSGQYSVIVDSPGFTDGDITISGTRYNGTAEYSSTVAIALTITDFEEAHIMTVQVTNSGYPYAVSGTPFTFIDDYNGTFSTLLITELSVGTYKLYLANARTSGTLQFDDDVGTGAVTYNYTGSAIVNLGASDTTDFDTMGGLVSGLARTLQWLGIGSDTFVIRTATNGFSDDYQEMNINYAGITPVVDKWINFYKSGHTYKIRLKYRAIGNALNISVFNLSGGSFVDQNFPINSGNCITIETNTFVPTAAKQLTLRFQSADEYGDITIQIDEVELIEV